MTFEDFEEQDFGHLAQHAQNAVAQYVRRQPFFQDLSGNVARIIEECLKHERIVVHSVQHRAKSAQSFGRKVAIPSDVDPSKPKYPQPFENITDLAGVRIITHFPATLDEVDRLLRKEFDVVESSNKGLKLIEEERFGYQSIHYLVKIGESRKRLSEYDKFTETLVEVQARTILQHAWAEIEHDIQYKSTDVIPVEIRRRFMALAGILEIADREFQAIQDADKELGENAKARVETGNLSDVEITPGALKLFLNRRLGPDGRMSDWSYDWDARLLRHLGFKDLKQVETAISPYNDTQLSLIAEGGRQGQSKRFELMLLAALGSKFFDKHPWGKLDWFTSRWHSFLESFEAAGIVTETYDPVQITKQD